MLKLRILKGKGLIQNKEDQQKFTNKRLKKFIKKPTKPRDRVLENNKTTPFKTIKSLTPPLRI